MLNHLFLSEHESAIGADGRSGDVTSSDVAPERRRPPRAGGAPSEARPTGSAIGGQTPRAAAIVARARPVGRSRSEASRLTEIKDRFGLMRFLLTRRRIGSAARKEQRQ